MEGNEPQGISAPLSKWLAAVGGPPQLTPGEAQQWLGVWISLNRAAQSAARPSTGQTTARPPPSRRTIAGRAVHKRFQPNTKVILNDGTAAANDEDAGRALVETRAEIWFKREGQLADADKILEAYSKNKDHKLPPKPKVKYRLLRGCILMAQGSAPGVDGTPYEIYHLHPQLFAALLAQAFRLLPEAENTQLLGSPDSILDMVLGPSIDLLLWIPKVVGDERVGNQRPLHLPTTMRRLFGSSCKHLLSPAIEPFLTPAQAAVAGGSCQGNIKAAHAHLAMLEEPERPPWRIPHAEWACSAVLKGTMAAVLRVCARRQRAAHPGIWRTPGCFLLDQAKAFEMLSHTWLRRVLQHWGLPKWAFAAFMSAAEGRRLRDKLRKGWISTILLRGAGMGGPMSPLTWDVAFDPILWITEVAGSCETLGYVDDLLAKIVGPGQAILIYLILLAATKMAGLEVEDHHCVTASVSRGYARAVQILDPFPTSLTATGSDGFVLRDGPVELLLEVLVESEAIRQEDIINVERVHCSCKTKHALVPAHSQQLWARALEGTPLAAAVTSQARFLGAFLTSRTRPFESVIPTWSDTAMRVCKALTWEKPIKKSTGRCDEMVKTGLALSLRVDGWNTFCVSTVPYPASIVLPDAVERAQLMEGVLRLFPTGKWAWDELPLHIGPALGLSQYPRDPRLVAATTAAMFSLTDKFAGPPRARLEVLDLIGSLRRWALEPEEIDMPSLRPGLSGMTGAKRMSRARTAIRQGLEPDQTVDRRSFARAVYLGLWAVHDSATTRNYLLQRSKQRRWAPSCGEEWVLLSQCDTWAAGWLITRLLLNGLPGTSSHRPPHLHGETRCWGCGIRERPQWRWLSPADVAEGSPDPGVAWCAKCCGASAKGRLPGEVGEGDDNGASLPGPPVPAKGCYTPCPFCGKGEAGAEHLAIFCQTVEKAWRVIEPGTAQWWLGWIDTNTPNQNLHQRALRFNRGLAFLACALGNTALPSEEVGVRMLVQQVTCCQQDTGAITDQVQQLETEEPEGVQNLREMWQGPRQLFTPGEEICQTCEHHSRRAVNTWHGAHPQRRTACSTHLPTAALIATEEIPADTNAFTLRATRNPACWPEGEQGIFGRPVPDTDLGDNIKWVCNRCRDCGAWRLTAMSTRTIASGDLIRGAPPPNTCQLPETAPPEFKVSFDGGARHKSPNNSLDPEGPRAVGAGAIVWGAPDQQGKREALAQIALAHPGESSSLTAEALGLRVAITLLLRVTQNPTSVDIVGDNLPILRMTASNGKVKAPEVWEILEAPIMQIYTQGWRCNWVAVRRTLNTAADKVATIGTLRSVDLAANNRESPPEIRLWERDPKADTPISWQWFPEYRVERSETPFWEPPGH